MDTVPRTDLPEDGPQSDQLSALSWVHGELRRSLEAAHKALRRYLKESEAIGRDDLDAVDPAVLRTARAQLHQGVGALEMVGQVAAADVLRAAETLVQRFISKPALVKPASVQVVERLSFALLDFLGRRLAGKPVSPLLMFPQYQAALQLAGVDRVHPADLWKLQWHWPDVPVDPTASARAGDEAARSEMETLVLTLMREPQRSSFARMSDLCANLAAGLRPHPGEGPLATLWQIAAGMFEALAAGQLDSDVHIKRLTSRLLAQLRMSVRGGSAQPERLAQDLLFFCAHAHAQARGSSPLADTPRLNAVRQAWQLQDWPTADYNVSRLGMFDPAQVALAKRRVSSAKDSWSAVAGGEQHRISGLMDQFALVGESLQKLFSTGDKLAHALSMAAAQTVASNQGPAPTLAMEVATAVLYLEAALEDGELDQPELAGRVQHLASRIDSVRAGADPKPLDIWMEDLYRRVSDRQTMGSVVQELRASLSEVEKQIDQYFRNPAERAVLIPVPAQLSSMRGVLSVLGLHQASQAALHMRDDVDALAQTVVDPQQAIQTGTFNRLADNLGALSFLIDMLSVQPQMAKSLFRFDASTGCLSAVMGQTERVSAFVDLEPQRPDVAAAAPATVVDPVVPVPSSLPTPAAFTVASTLVASLAAPAAASPTVAAGLAAPALMDWAPPAAPRAAVAPESSLNERLQALANGAQRASVSDDEVVSSLDLLSEQCLVADQRELSAMLSQAQIRLRETIDPATSRALRHELARAINLRLQPRAPQELPAPDLRPVPPPHPVPVGGTGLEDDAEMREVFVDEAHEVIAAADAALQRLAQAADSASDMTEVRRAFHTLKGSSRMVGLRDFGDAAWACEQLYNARLAQLTSLDPAMRTFSQDALAYLNNWVLAIAAGVPRGHHSAAVTEPADALRLHGELRAIEHPASAPSQTAQAAAPAPTPTLPTSAPAPTPAAPESPPLAVQVSAAPEPVPEPVPVPAAEAQDSSLQRLVPGLPSAADLDLDFDFELQPSTADAAPEAAPPPLPEPAGVDLDLDFDLQPSQHDIFAKTLLLPHPLVRPAAHAAPLAAPVTGLVLEPTAEITAEITAEPIAEPIAKLTAEPAVDLLDEPAVGPAVERLFEPVDEPVDEPIHEPFDALASEAPAVPVAEPEVYERELAELDQFFGFTPDPQARFGRPTEPGDLPVVAPGDSTLLHLLTHAQPQPLDGAEPAPGWNRLSGHFPPLDLDFDLPPADAPQPIAVAPAPPAAAVPAQEPSGALQEVPEAALEDEPFKVVGPLRISIPLFNIFLNEADEQSRRLVTELAEWSMEWHTRPVPESSAALAHSLAGNSGTVGGADLCALARALEHALTRSAEGGRGRPGEADLFCDTAEEIRRLLHQFAAGFLREVAPGLLDRLAEHERWPALEPEVNEAADAPEAADTATSETAPAPEPVPVPVPVPVLVPVPIVNSEAIPAVLPTSLPLFVPSFVPSPAPEPVPALAPAAALRLVSTGARADAFDDDRDIDAQDVVDHELFPIFEEEAEELLPQLQSRLRDWMHQPGDSSQPAACMRTLHTFKGGARLSGAMRLGEMAHRLETAIEHLASRPQLQAADVEPLLGRADAMSTLFDTLRKPARGLSALDPSADLAPDVVPDLAPELPPKLAVEASPLASAPGPAAVDEPAAAAPPPTAPDKEWARAAPAALAVDWSRFTLASNKPAALADRAVAAAAPVRVRAALLDRLVNQAGEVSITRSRIDADVKLLQGSLGDLTESLERMRRQLRDIEVQAETQISSRLEAAKAAAQTFDPLEMDRFTRFQELTRFMAESVNDVATLQRSLQRTLQSTEDELAAQARLTRELQDDLLRTRMVEFESAADRLYRTVRQAAKDSGKSVKLDIMGGAIEVDRGVLERMTGAFEHLLRNCVAHGIESPDQRLRAGKPADGQISITVAQAGNEVVVAFADDGAGLDLARIRSRAVERGLLAAQSVVSDADLVQMIFRPGFSTAEQVTELSGRGVGLDVVRAEVLAIGGSIDTQSQSGRGTTMSLRLPLTTAVTRVVMLRCGTALVAVPTTLIELVRRVPTAEVLQAYQSGELVAGSSSQQAGQGAGQGGASTAPALPFYWLAALLQPGSSGPTSGRTQTVVIVRSAQQRVAVHVDEVLGNQEVVVKNVGPQLARVPGLAGVTLLPSGAVALIYNPVALANVYGAELRRQPRRGGDEAAPAATAPASEGLPNTRTPGAEPPLAAAAAGQHPAGAAPLVMVVDDSLTVRRVTQRLLVREGYRVVTAKDGLDALDRLAQERPAVLLSDIEMPRMDGFDLLRNVRADARLAGLPVVMITSRIAQKHRDHAHSLGADHYLGKPFAEDELLAWIARRVAAQRAVRPKDQVPQET